MIRISRNTWVTLKKGQGYIQNYFYVVEGLFANNKIGRASFGKELERGGALNRKGRRGGG